MRRPRPSRRPRPPRAPPPRPAPSRSPHPPPGSSTQTFRPARSLLRARRLPLASGSFRTFRPAPSPRPSPRPPPRDPLPAPRPGSARRSAPASSDQVSRGHPEAPRGEVAGGSVGCDLGMGESRGAGSLNYCPARAGAPDLGAGKFRGKGGSSPGSPAHQHPAATGTSWSGRSGSREVAPLPSAVRLWGVRTGARGRHGSGGCHGGARTQGAHPRAAPPFGLRLALPEPARPSRTGRRPRRPAPARCPRLGRGEGVSGPGCARLCPRGAGACVPSGSAPVSGEVRVLP